MKVKSYLTDTRRNRPSGLLTTGLNRLWEKGTFTNNCRGGLCPCPQFVTNFQRARRSAAPTGKLFYVFQQPVKICFYIFPIGSKGFLQIGRLRSSDPNLQRGLETSLYPEFFATNSRKNTITTSCKV